MDPRMEDPLCGIPHKGSPMWDPPWGTPLGDPLRGNLKILEPRRDRDC